VSFEAMTPHEVHFTIGYDKRAEAEHELKGFLCGVVVRHPTQGTRSLTSYDAVRLAQELAAETAAGRPFVVEPGLIVLDRVNRHSIDLAIATFVSMSFDSDEA
jgi:hypothetical protein